jgi:hypothetical protein
MNTIIKPLRNRKRSKNKEYNMKRRRYNVLSPGSYRSRLLYSKFFSRTNENISEF